MRKSWLLCVLLGTLAWGQAAPGTPPPPQPMHAPAPPPDLSASVPPTAAVITVEGVCSAPAKAAAPKAAPATAPASAKAPAAKTPAADCKTIITKAEFERLANGVSPNMTPQLKQQLANVLPRLIALSSAAKKKGLDKSPRFEETVKFAKMQILTNELQRNIQEEAAKVPAEEIAAYYKEHLQDFEQYNLDRIFVPRSKQDTDDDKDDADKNAKLTEEEQKAKQAKEKAEADEAEQAMNKLAESLRTRAAAGEDVVKLQKEAFDAAGMKVESPTVNLPKVRSRGLPPAHAAALELKPGEVSQVISDTGGHYIYKMNSKDVIPLDQAREEIHNTLQNQRSHDMMDKLNASFKVEKNEAYFGAGGPPMPQGPGAMGGRMGTGQMPPRGGPKPQMAPSPMAPPPAQQTPPPTPAAKPN